MRLFIKIMEPSQHMSLTDADGNAQVTWHVLLLEQESEGREKDFSKGLKVGIYAEVVPMGISPKAVSHQNAGKIAFKYLQIKRPEQGQKNEVCV